MIGIFRKGEHISVLLCAVEGDPAQASNVTAVMRKVRLSGSSVVYGPGAPIAMAVTPHAGDAQFPGGWIFTVPAEVTAGLEVGTYGIDARMEIGSGVEITDETAVIQISEAILS